MGSSADILMCPPDFYGIEYEINPWMDIERQVDHDLAVRQWNDLRSALQQAGATIHLLHPIRGLPDLVFTANAAMIYQRQAVLSRFRHAQRQGEEEYDRDWLRSYGFQVLDLPEGVFFEGAGDALFCGSTLFAGYRMRSDVGGHQQVGGLVGQRVIPMELIDGYYYHLDTCFCPLDLQTGLFYPAAFDEYGRKVLNEHVETLIEVSEEEAREFACNAVVVGRTVITNTGCDRLHEELKRHGYQPVATPLSEFVKAGGSAKCLTLRLDGEEGAGWKTAAAKA